MRERESLIRLVLRPARLTIVLLTIGRRTLQNVIDRVDCNLDALLTAGILLKVCFYATLYSRSRTDLIWIGSVTSQCLP